MRHSDNDRTFIDNLYNNGEKLGVMRDFHLSCTKKGLSPFSYSYEIISQRKELDIIDAGCGVGSFWSKFDDYRFVNKLELWDQSASLLNKAYESAISNEIRIIEKRVIDLNDKHLLPDFKADYILAHQEYHHLEEPELTHVELLRMLKYEGSLLASTCNLDHMNEIYTEIAEYFGVPYEAVRGLQQFNGGHLEKLPGMVSTTKLYGTISCCSAEQFVKYVNSLSVLEQIQDSNKFKEKAFLIHLKEWADKKIRNNGSIILTQSVTHSMFKNFA